MTLASTSTLPLRRLGWLVAAVTCLADQLLKWAMIGPLALPLRHETRMLGGDFDATRADINLLPFFGFSWTQNFGVSLGLFTAQSDAQRWALVAVTMGIAVGVWVWLGRAQSRADAAALGLVLGGAIGNIIDRSARGFVVDYLDLHLGEIRPFLIFNLADVAITFGVLILLAGSFLLREKRAHTAHQPAPADPAKTAPET